MDAIEILFNQEVIDDINSIKDDINQSSKLKEQIISEIKSGEILEYINVFDEFEQVRIIKEVVEDKKRKDIRELCLLMLFVNDNVRESVIPFLSKSDIYGIIIEVKKLEKIELSKDSFNCNSSDNNEKKFIKLRIKLLFEGFIKKIKKYK